MKQSFKSLLSIIVLTSISNVLYSQQNVTVSVSTDTKTALMDNGIISISINSKGQVESLIYNEKDLIDANNHGRFYFSYNDQYGYYELYPDKVWIEKQTDDYAEVIYSNTTGNLHIEQAYILLKEVSGIYIYVTVRGTSTPVTLRELRVVYRVNPSLFYYGYVTDEMQGVLPTIEDMITALDHEIMDATYVLPDGSVYTKYDWSNYVDKDSVHGVLSDNEGVWAIAPSNEFMNGGPMKQELTVHTTSTTPLALQMLQGEHFGALAQDYSLGDEKIYGPFFLYVNSGSTHEEMIDDAKIQASLQRSLWPYQWLSNSLYPIERTEVTGKINIPFGLSAKNIQVVLAQPDMDIYDQGKQYMYWDLTDSDGQFTMPHVRAGNYTLYAYATEGEITDILTLNDIVVSNSNTDLGTIDWTITKYENKLWQIGENDRLTKGFKMSDTLRSDGLYNLPPDNLNYQIGSSTPENDWYYAQTKSGTWTVSFNCNNTYSGSAVLTTSIAGATNYPEVEVYINNIKKATWLFGNDRAVYRSAVLSGRHEVKTLTFPASDLIIGANTVAFKMTNVGFQGGLMYDCIKLEAGQILTSIDETLSTVTHSIVSNYPNPFNSMTNISYSIPTPDFVTLIVYNMLGQEIQTLVNKFQLAGYYNVNFDANNFSSGVYVYKLQVGDPSNSSGQVFIETKKMILIR
jgi:rhamnogalacturonan endolyase